MLNKIQSKVVISSKRICADLVAPLSLFLRNCDANPNHPQGFYSVCYDAAGLFIIFTLAIYIYLLFQPIVRRGGLLKIQLLVGCPCSLSGPWCCSSQQHTTMVPDALFPWNITITFCLCCRTGYGHTYSIC